jgi:ligand-binding SRPBCC domain-containing protein
MFAEFVHSARMSQRFECEQWLPVPRERLFPFFADVTNLEAITPPFLRFEVLTPDVEVRAGAIIDYKLRVHGIPLRWRSEITVWEPPHRFVDEQRRGPYRRWHHEHRFEEKDDGTLCIDTVDYAVLGGALIETLFVRRDVERIFAFRQTKLQELFGNG